MLIGILCFSLLLLYLYLYWVKIVVQSKTLSLHGSIILPNTFWNMLMKAHQVILYHVLKAKVGCLRTATLNTPVPVENYIKSTWPLGHLVYWSLCHPIITWSSPGHHLVTPWSLGPLVTWLTGYLVTWVLGCEVFQWNLRILTVFLKSAPLKVQSLQYLRYSFQGYGPGSLVLIRDGRSTFIDWTLKTKRCVEKEKNLVLWDPMTVRLCFKVC